jgi:16S rRNA G966 N2-methylase RsmD
MLHGIFCDPASSEESRVNAINICQEFVDKLPPKTKSELIDRHSGYLAQGDKARSQASSQFFEQLGLLSLLSDSEQHSLITNAAKKLFTVHQAFDNFYNDPPFAERLSRLLKQAATPDTAKEIIVEVVITCATGNRYGISNAAAPYYHDMVKGFSPAEIGIMLSLPETNTIVGNRVDVCSRVLMVHYYLLNGRRPYGTNSPWQRHNDRGGASSNTK